MSCISVRLAPFGAAVSVILMGSFARAAENGAATAPPAPPLQQVTNSTDIVRLVQGWVSQHHVTLWVAYLLVAAVVGYGLFQFRKTELAAKLRRTLEDEVLTNWRLTLLGITSLALTLASGWTTWDGMTNFTGTPLLSFLITIGIQGVMLIAAWLIGESFAIGLAGSGRTAKWSTYDWLLAVLSILLMAGAFYSVAMAATYHGTIEAIDGALRRHKSELALPMPTENLRVLIGLGISGILTLLIVTQTEVFEPYFRGLKVILKSLPLWVMFLSCMVTSVFFSFDSLFSTIFPQSERERAAQLRTTNQVAGIVADLGATITKRQADSVDALFTSPQWTEFSNHIGDIIGIARSAPDQLAELARKELEAQQSTRAGLEERKASAESQQVRLDKRKEELLADVNKLKEEVPPVAAEVDRLKGESFTKDSEILAKKAETQAEAGGVGGTLKVGQGPVWAARKKEMDDLAKLKAIVEGQLKDRSDQLKSMRDKIASAEAELAQIDGEIGKLRGEMDVADKQMAAATAPKPEGSVTAAAQNITTNGFGSLEDAFAQFRQHPERKAFDGIQQQCAALLAVFDKVPAIKSQADTKGVRCDPSVVAEPVARILALNDGLAAYRERCSKPDSLPQSGVDELLAFGQQCVQSSGLEGRDTALYRSEMNSIGLNRDDKAHRFVVSWNAFLDGNRLAYLALLIAIALDGLVFMSGLFGANATSSPLVRLPSAARRSAADLEATMYAALRPDIYGRAKLVINALHPIQPRDGFVSEIRLNDYERETRSAIRSVLSMASQFGAVEPDPRDTDVYLVRGELTEFLSKACERELRINPRVQEAAEAARAAEAERHARFEQERQGEVELERKLSAKELQDERDLQRRAKVLEPVLTAALVHGMDDSVELYHRSSGLLASIQPTAGNKEFTSEIDLDSLPSGREFFRSVLNAAAARKAVQKDKSASGELYLIRPEMILCLTAIRVKAFDNAQKEARRQQSWTRRLGFGGGRRSRDGRQNASASDAGAPQGILPSPPRAQQPPTNIIQIPYAGGSGAKRGVPASARDIGPAGLGYIKRLKQRYGTGSDGGAFDGILRNEGWVNALDARLHNFETLDEFRSVLAQADSDIAAAIGEFDQSLSNFTTAPELAEAEVVKDAFRVWQRLGAVRAHLKERINAEQASQSDFALLDAIKAIFANRPDAIDAFEAAVEQVEGGNRVSLASGDSH